MTLRNRADYPRETAKLSDLLDVKRERFVRRCLLWRSAQALADDLTLHGFECSERQASAWRARQFKKTPGDAYHAVAWLIEEIKTAEALAYAERVRGLAGEVD